MNETDDGAAAVGDDPVNAQHTFQHLENMTGVIALPEERWPAVRVSVGWLLKRSLSVGDCSVAGLKGMAGLIMERLRFGYTWRRPLVGLREGI